MTDPSRLTEAVLPQRSGPDCTLVLVSTNVITDAAVTIARAAGLDPVVLDHADGSTADALARMAPGPRHAVVLTDHDAPGTADIVRSLLASDVGYLGQMGSRKRATGMFVTLREDGVSEEALGRLNVPVGLDVGGRSAGEIALSLVAEVVAWANGKLVRVGDRSGLPGPG